MAPGHVFIIFLQVLDDAVPWQVDDIGLEYIIVAVSCSPIRDGTTGYCCLVFWILYDMTVHSYTLPFNFNPMANCSDRDWICSILMTGYLMSFWFSSL